MLKNNFLYFILRKIDACLQMGNLLQDIMAQVPDPAGKLPGKMPFRHLQGGSRPRLYHIHDCLSLGKIQTSVEKGTFREFPTFCGSCSRLIGQCQSPAQGHRSPMALKLHNILLRIGMRTSHDEGNGLIHKFSLKIADMTINSPMGLHIRQLLSTNREEYLLCCPDSCFAADPYDADPCGSLWSRNGTNGIALLHKRLLYYRI